MLTRLLPLRSRARPSCTALGELRPTPLRSDSTEMEGGICWLELVAGGHYEGLCASAANANWLACPSNCSFCNFVIVASWPVNVHSLSLCIVSSSFFFFSPFSKTPDHCIIQSLFTNAPVWSNRGSQCGTACPHTTSAGRLCPGSSARKDMKPGGAVRVHKSPLQLLSCAAVCRLLLFSWFSQGGCWGSFWRPIKNSTFIQWLEWWPFRVAVTLAGFLWQKFPLPLELHET